MAQQTITLYARKWGFTDQSDPVRVQDLTGKSSVYLYKGSRRLYVEFDEFPSALRKKKLYGANAKFHVRLGYYHSGNADRTVMDLYPSLGKFNPATLVWANQPSVPSRSYLKTDLGMSEGDYEFLPAGASAAFSSELAKNFTLYNTGEMENFGPYTYNTAYFPYLSDGTSLPYLQLTYDDAEDATSQVVIKSYPSGTVNASAGQTFSWELGPDTYWCAAGFTQQSAILFWKESTESTWNQINISGSGTSYTAPSGTFPGGKTIQYYIRATDTEGNTSQTSTYSFNTAASQIAATVYPSGNGVDPRTAINFAWVYNSSAGKYSQRSAILHYHLVGSAWQAYNIADSTQSVAIPANTFPTGGQVEWYLEGTDISGVTTQTAQASFKTVSTKVVQQGGPTDGYCDPRNAITFSWYLESAVGDYTQDHASFFWRISGAVSWTEVQISGNTKSITFPANTFPVASTIEWYISATDTGGMTTETAQFSFSTAAGTTIATCVSPTGTAEDGTKPITFHWTIQNSDGTAPKRTVLLWKTTYESALEWHTILDTTENINEHTVAGSYFPAGPVQWKVYAYNRDDVQGPESESSFICIIAPSAPAGLAATPVPLTTISWQSSGQEGYEIKIDGEIVAKEYGPAVYSYKVKEPLPDGEHIITVRIQGLYSMWSNPSTTSIFVTNTPEGSINLNGLFDVDADLSFTETPSESNVEAHWYRDGIRIADTEDVREYIDRCVLGEHSYYVEIWHSSGNYTRSNTVTGEMESTVPRIMAIDGTDWLELRLSENSEREQGFSWSIEAAHFRTTASRWPILELSPYESLAGSYECAFYDRNDVRAFESLRGKVVIMKTQRGNVLIGGLIQTEKREKEFFTAVSFAIQQIHMEGIADGQND